MADLYHGKDPREIPNYSLRDAARLTGVPSQTLRSWVTGRSYPTARGGARSAPLIDRPEPASPLLSFINVVEAHVLAAIRHGHGVPMQNVRPAIEYVRKQLGLDHPLAARVFVTDGVELFVEHFDVLVSASRGGQVVIRELIEAHLKRIDYDTHGLARRLYPFVRRVGKFDPQEMTAAPKLIVIDPRVSFGRPILRASGIPTAVIADRFQAGETVQSIAEDCDRVPEEIEEALRYERLAA